MAEMIIIREDTFHAALYLDSIASLPMTQLIRLFNIMLINDYLDDNKASIEFLTEWIPNEMTIAKSEWEQANKNYANGWKPIGNPRLQTPEVKQQKNFNADLSADVARTRNRYNAIQKIQKCFTKAKQNQKRSTKL